MAILDTLNKLSFKKIAGLTFVVALALAIPLTVNVALKQTKLGSQALFEKPQPIIPTKQYGAPSEGEPVITLVWPFLGKVGDSVLIHGQNLGNNPIDKSLKVGSESVIEEEIVRWTPDLIEFMIPQQAKAGPVNLTVAGQSASWPYPFTVYSLDTKTQVTENNDVVRVLSGPAGGKAEIYFNDAGKIESANFQGINVPGDKTIISVLIKDKNNLPLPFFVEPAEFGF